MTRCPIPAPRLRRCTCRHPMSGEQCSKPEHTDGCCELRDASGRVYGGWLSGSVMYVFNNEPQETRE